MNDQDRSAVTIIVVFFFVIMLGAIKGQIDKQKPDTPPPQIERNCQ